MGIIGIDPGTTTAVAILDLNGEIINIKSKRGFSKSEIVEFILLNCKPILIGTDVSKVPHLVKKISASFGIRIYSPKEDLGSLEKEKLVKNFCIENINSHTQDALSAAYSTFLRYKDLFLKIKKHLKRVGKSGKFGEILEIVLQENISVDAALKSLEKPKKLKSEKKISKRFDWEKRAKKLQKVLNNQQEKIKNLEDYILSLKNKISSLENKIESLNSKKKAFSISNYNKKILKLSNQLKNEQVYSKNLKKNLKANSEKIELLREVLKKLRMGWQFVEVISNKKDLESTRAQIVYIKENFKFDRISENIKLIISPNQKLNMDNIPIFSPQDLNLIVGDDFAIIDPKELTWVEKNFSPRFLNWLNFYREKRHVQKNY